MRIEDLTCASFEEGEPVLALGAADSSRYLFAPGAPDSTGYDDLSRLLVGLLKNP